MSDTQPRQKPQQPQAGQHTVDAQRDLSQEYRLGQVPGVAEVTAQLKMAVAGESMSHTATTAGVQGGKSAPQQESLREAGRSTDTVRDAAGRDGAERDAPHRGAGALEQDVAMPQGVRHDISPEQEQAAGKRNVQQQMAVERDTGKAMDAAAAKQESQREMPKDLDQHTAKSAQEGILGSANPLSGKNPKNMDAAKNAVQESGLLGALEKSGISSTQKGNSLFGDGGKSLAAPSTPGQKAFTADKAEKASAGLGR